MYHRLLCNSWFIGNILITHWEQVISNTTLICMGPFPPPSSPQFLQPQCLMGRQQQFPLKGGDQSGLRQHQHHLGASGKCQLWGPTPNLLKHNLFYKISRWSVCTLKLEMHWSKGNPLPVIGSRIGTWLSSGQQDVKNALRDASPILLGEMPSFWKLCVMWPLELP